MTLKFNRFLEVVKIQTHAKFIKLSAAVHELSTVHYILDNSRRWW